ncbi:hypothetical protein FQR65_LT02979 [Abscondita terminalis]|nr:hypothetical protein FQR65_LT02979 [Abscondita terminalis]
MVLRIQINVPQCGWGQLTLNQLNKITLHYKALQHRVWNGCTGSTDNEEVAHKAHIQNEICSSLSRATLESAVPTLLAVASGDICSGVLFYRPG